MQVLVVDDDVSMRELMKLHLTKAGYSVDTAEDAVVAGRRLLHSTPQIILIDVELPFLSGVEFAATLVADSTIPHVPIILMSAHEHFAGKADSLGVSFLVKPFTKDELLKAVARSASGTAALRSSVSHPSRFSGVARALVHRRAAMARR